LLSVLVARRWNRKFRNQWIPRFANWRWFGQVCTESTLKYNLHITSLFILFFFLESVAWTVNASFVQARRMDRPPWRLLTFIARLLWEILLTCLCGKFYFSQLAFVFANYNPKLSRYCGNSETLKIV
jgi:hypothetical protein